MGNNLLTNNPFAVLTFIAAPALLTNATSVLVLSTANRMLRTRDRMRELLISLVNIREEVDLIRARQAQLNIPK